MYKELVGDGFITLNTAILIVSGLIAIGLFYYGRKTVKEMNDIDTSHVSFIKKTFVFYARILKNGFPLAPLFIILVILLNFFFGGIRTLGELWRAVPFFILMTILVRTFTQFAVRAADKIVEK